MKKKTDILYRSLQLLLAVSSLLAAWFSFSPFAKIKGFFDLFTPDRNLEAFTLALYENSLPFILGLGIISVAGFLLAGIFPRKSRALLTTILESLHASRQKLKEDRHSFWLSAKRSLSQDRDWQILLLMMVVGAYFRILFLNNPMTHDEAYTYITFVLSGFKNLISDYHLPNNHIFYSIFVYLSVHLFGNAPWVLRLPALLAGVLLIPASYLAARQPFNRPTALLTSGIITAFPVFILYSASARGYAQIALLSTLLWFFATSLLKKRNLFVWVLFILTAAAGFYTIPIMAYPYTATMAWLFINWLLGEYTGEYEKKEFFQYLFLSGVFVVVLFGVLYFPVFIKTGFGSLFYSDPIRFLQESEGARFVDSFYTRIRRTWQEWHEYLPVIFSWITLLGVLGSSLWHRKITGRKTNYFLVSFLVIGSIVFVQKVVGWARVWFFFAPIYFSFAAAGLTYLFQWISKGKKKATFAMIAILLMFSLGATGFWVSSDTQEMRELRGEPAALERGIQYLDKVITEEDAIVAASTETPAMQYYAFYYGIPLSQTHPADNVFTSIYAVLTTADATLKETLHSGTSDRVDLNASELVYKDDDLRIYKIPIVIFYEE